MDDTSTAPAITFFWRPGCGFCRRLAADLERADVPFERVNIWEDDQAAAFVRSVASGNEVVPTVRIGSTALVNPSVGEVLRAARAHADPGADDAGRVTGTRH